MSYDTVLKKFASQFSCLVYLHNIGGGLSIQYPDEMLLSMRGNFLCSETPPFHRTVKAKRPSYIYNIVRDYSNVQNKLLTPAREQSCRRGLPMRLMIDN